MRKNLKTTILILFLILIIIFLYILPYTYITPQDMLTVVNKLYLQLMLGLAALLIFYILAELSSQISEKLSRVPTKNFGKKRFRTRHGLWRKRKEEEQSWDANFWQGISTELWGAMITTALLGIGLLVFQQYQELQNQKDDLILQLGSADNELATEAVRFMAHEGWLYDGTLTTIYLPNANLQSANLANANLRGTNLANANLQGANLSNANLQGANLYGANLRGANLYGANLRGANLLGTFFDENTLLPDIEQIISETGVVEAILLKPWTPQTDMSIYTDPNHPDFWQSN